MHGVSLKLFYYFKFKHDIVLRGILFFNEEYYLIVLYTAGLRIIITKKNQIKSFKCTFSQPVAQRSKIKE